MLDTSKGTYLLSMSVENIKCFGPKQELDLSDGKGNPAKWTVILGDNGTGKTTLLQLISMSELREEVYPDGSKKQRDLLYNRKQPYIYWADRLVRGKHGNIELIFTGKDGNFKSTRLISHKPIKTLTTELKYLSDQVYCYAYGATRRMGEVSLSGEKKIDNMESLFNYDTTLYNPIEWLIMLDYAVKGRTYKGARDKREQVIRMLVEMLPEVESIDIVINKEDDSTPIPSVLFKTKYGWVQIDDLSLGYKTMISWIVDLAKRLFDRYPDSPNPIEEPAIVLIDEIDLHLHPKWQRELINYLDERFKQTQFIVTAHSPLIVQTTSQTSGSEHVNVVVLRREDDYVVIDKDLDYVRSWRVDQLFASDLFGISPYPAKTQQLLNERRRLLSKSKLTEKDKSRLNELDQNIGYLPTAESKEDIEAMKIIRETAAKLKDKGDACK